MKKSEMEVGIIYIICPNKKCRLFWDTSRYCPCDGKCPHKGKLKFVIICHNCGEMIVLSGIDKVPRRVDHQCPDGRNAFNFSTTTYYLLYKMPTNK